MKGAAIRSIPGLLFVFLFATLTNGYAQKYELTVNSYQEINWNTVIQYKANFHSHSTNSDGLMDPFTVIEHYYSNDYNILALTDHDVNTYLGIRNNTIWQDRYSEMLDFMLIEGSSEISSGVHHTGSLFNDFARSTGDGHYALHEIGKRDGLAMFYHPGRYNHRTNWYIEFFEEYDHLLGMEVYNQGGRYSGDRILWEQCT